MKLLPILATLLAIQFVFTSDASAASPEAIQAVLVSDALKEASGGRADIINIREDAVYRCPGCFSFELTLGRGEEAKKVFFFTSSALVNGEWVYSVKVKQEPKPAARCIALGRVGGEDRACAKHTDQNSCESKTDWEWCSWQSR